MLKEKNVVAAMLELANLFAKHTAERSTLDELQEMLSEDAHWLRAHELFDRIRRKTLEAIKRKNHLLAAQYSFEEIYAKTLFNLRNRDAPFDPDSPYFVIPFALNLARAFQISDAEIIEIVAPRDSATQI